MSTTLAQRSSEIAKFIALRGAGSNGKVKSAIVQRWNTRIIPRGLNQLGREGAGVYLESYGKGISVAKIIELAVCAESNGAAEMAAGFWEEAFFMESGVRGTVESGAMTPATGVQSGMGGAARTKGSSEKKVLAGIVETLQPGLVHTMQAVDAPWEREFYIEDEDYYGQPKRDGHRDVLFSTDEMVVHQSRSTSLMASMDRELEGAVKQVAGEIGPFVLDGERYYLSETGSEHRSAAQAAGANIEAGFGNVQPVAVYGVFKALYADGEDLRGGTEDCRIEAGERIVALIEKANKGSAKIEAVPTYKTSKEKRKLVKTQMEEGREGEIWVKRQCSYSGGKSHKTDMVRTKYVTEGVYTVVSISTSSGRKGGIASIEVANNRGEMVGSVGTGFDESLSRKLLDAHASNPKGIRVLVRHQGTTEKGKLWHARVLEIA